ncbi:acyl-lipid (9-3)-desaturase-like [Euphorbia lathyris]|uniref:acyl-lipid (9-3)-desaturase-like n=1 Tax=Euphorbia lathyris TaxID=212925 RepID=UPI0033136516
MDPCLLYRLLKQLRKRLDPLEAHVPAVILACCKLKIWTMGTLNINCSTWMDWFHGGLQFQIEHHLFPRLPRRNLRKISLFVIELCKKHNFLDTSASFFKANEMALKTLQTVALQARDLKNPVSKNLVWEAVNAHG